MRKWASFNSRARKGRDPDSGDQFETVTSFNSRARKGRDTMIGEDFTPAEFQFTRPQGARRIRSVPDCPNE